MPKNTFTQLPEEKKERILRAAAVLFAGRGFAKTDVAQIAEMAGVAKGSIYNYFDSKEELYLFVCRDGIERSRKAVYGGIRPEWDIYRQVEHLFRNGVAFAMANPEYISLYINISSAGMESFADQLTLDVEKHTADYLKHLITEGISKGIVSRDTDVNLAAFLINSLYVMLLVSLISRHFKIRIKEYLEIESDVNEESIETHLSRVIGLIHRFLMPQSTISDELNR